MSISPIFLQAGSMFHIHLYVCIFSSLSFFFSLIISSLLCTFVETICILVFPFFKQGIQFYCNCLFLSRDQGLGKVVFIGFVINKTFKESYSAFPSCSNNSQRISLTFNLPNYKAYLAVFTVVNFVPNSWTHFELVFNIGALWSLKKRKMEGEKWKEVIGGHVLKATECTE